MADLSIEFPNSGPYPGHFKEKGYNALFINNAANCFARNLRILNAGAAGRSLPCVDVPVNMLELTLGTAGAKACINEAGSLQIRVLGACRRQAAVL